jgi:hypothetical protein
MYSLDIGDRLDAQRLHQFELRNLTELGQTGKGFKVLGSNLFNLVAELNQGAVFSFSKNFRLALSP